MSEHKIKTSRYDEYDDYQAASHSTTDYSNFVPPVGKQSRRKTRKIITGLFILIFLAGITVGSYWLLVYPNRKAQPAKTVLQTSQPKYKFATTTKQYQSI